MNRYVCIHMYVYQCIHIYVCVYVCVSVYVIVLCTLGFRHLDMKRGSD